VNHTCRSPFPRQVDTIHDASGEPAAGSPFAIAGDGRRETPKMTSTPRSALPGTISTARLKLRGPIRGDVPAIARLANNRAIYDMLARLPFPYTRADAIAFVEIVAQRDTERCYSVVLGEEFIGVVSFHYAQGEPPELGYWFGEPHWGRGYGTEAAGGLVEAAQATGLYPLIRARALSRNLRSRRVLEKLGFTLAGEGPEEEGSHAGAPTTRYLLEQRRWM
jgi:RimJ/RimL family protein N-acetyltransferase